MGEETYVCVKASINNQAFKEVKQGVLVIVPLFLGRLIISRIAMSPLTWLTDLNNSIFVISELGCKGYPRPIHFISSRQEKEKDYTKSFRAVLL